MRIVDEQADGGKVLHRIVGRLGLQSRREREVGRCQQQRVTVRRGLLHGLRADEARRARPVVDDDRLAEELRQLVGNHAPDEIRGPAGRERNDQAYGLRGIGLRGGLRSTKRKRGRDRAERDRA
jgi:hypothetical protein